MKKTIFCVLAFGLITVLSNGQVEISIKEDNPQDMKVFRVRIPLWVINLSNHNLSAYDARFGLDIQPSDKLMFNVDYNVSLLEKLYPTTSEGLEYPTQPYIVSDKAPSKSNYFNLEGTYFFSIKNVDTRLPITLKSSGNTNYYTMVPATMMKRFGIHLGFKKGISYYHMGDFTLLANEVIGNSEGQLEDKSTMLQHTQMRIGFNYSRSTNLHVTAKGYGDRSNSGMVNYYADLLLGLSSKIDDVYLVQQSTSAINRSYYSHLLINDYNEKAKIGFELGVRVIPTVGIFSYHAALGRLNGLKGGPNGYLEMGVSFSIGKKQKPRSSAVPTLFDSVPGK
jgi:hypothetical protein